MSGMKPTDGCQVAEPDFIRIACRNLGSIVSRADLGREIAEIVLTYVPADLVQMNWNFSANVSSVNSEYKKRLEETITGHIHGTYQEIRLMNQQGTFSSMQGPVPDKNPAYWRMVVTHCASEGPENRLRFLKFLLAGFRMLVQGLPGHPAGMPFPGNDTVESIDGVWYCPVREKANDIDTALCPFCPALQTPEIGYLKPPVNASRHRKQEYIRNCYEFHHFNG